MLHEELQEQDIPGCTTIWKHIKEVLEEHLESLELQMKVCYCLFYIMSSNYSMPQWFYRSPWERYHLQWICGLIPILCHSWPWLCIGLKGHMKRQLVGKNWFLSYKPIWLDSRESQDAMMANIWLMHSFMWQIAWRLLKMYFPQHSILI